MENNLSDMSIGELEAEVSRMQGNTRWWLIRVIALPVILCAVGLIIFFVKNTYYAFIIVGIGVVSIPITLRIYLQKNKMYIQYKARLDEARRQAAADRAR